MKKDARSDILTNLLSKETTAQALNVSTRTLDRWHTLRTGPPRFLVGRKVTYDRREVVFWLEDEKSKSVMPSYSSLERGEL